MKTNKTALQINGHGMIMTVLFVFLAEAVCAQSSSKDSLWLKDVLFNGKELQLKPEVIEAIRAGEFINFNHQNRNHHEDGLISPMQLPLQKDFTEYIQKPDTELSPLKIDYTILPPSVFMLYFKSSPIIDYRKLQSFRLAGIENYTPNRPKHLLDSNTLEIYPLLSVN